MSVIVVYNPVCGDSTAEQFFNAHVIPRLKSANQIPSEIIRTRAPGDAGEVVLDFLKKHKGDLTVVLGSGDGTLHEILNHLAFVNDHSFSIHFVLVPCGTANALYASLFGPAPPHETVAYKLRSLEAFLGSSTVRPLSLSLTSLLGPGGSDYDRSNARPVLSVVVTSTALHAAILRDSEKLRKQTPGIERFKIAAQQNISKWYSGHVKLFPTPSSSVIRIYDPQKGDFVPVGDSNQRESALDLHGPFAYFLSTVNVDRLESLFRITPTISKNPPTETSMDVVVIRPKRDPTSVLDTPQAREKFAEKTFTILSAAYQDGNHVNLRYLENGDITESGDGDTAVECFRCGGWEWTPVRLPHLCLHRVIDAP